MFLCKLDFGFYFLHFYLFSILNVPEFYLKALHSRVNMQILAWNLKIIMTSGLIKAFQLLSKYEAKNWIKSRGLVRLLQPFS